jgi:hypothetical protein
LWVFYQLTKVAGWQTSNNWIWLLFIQATPLGEWIFKSKSKQNSCGLQGACKGFMFGLQVTELLETWPEQVTHGRRWVSGHIIPQQQQ